MPDAHAKGIKTAGDAIATAFNAAASAAGIRPGSPLPRATHKPWAGAQAKVTVTDGDPAVQVGLSQGAELRIGDTPTKAHIEGGKLLGTRKSIASRVAKASEKGGPAKFTGRKSASAKGSKILHYGTSFSPYVHQPGSRRVDVWPAMEAAARDIAPRAIQAATIGALADAGFGL